jgi:hypothetical protein
VLVTTRPGTPIADSRLIRRLVYLWIGQNVFLVASTMLRTVDYIEAYLLTELRIEALLWMALVALGLVLICVRLSLGKTSAWLINANLAGRRPGARRFRRARLRSHRRGLERSARPRGRRPRLRNRPLLPQPDGRFGTAAADRTGKPAAVRPNCGAG